MYFWKLNNEVADAYPGKPVYNYTVGGWFFLNSAQSNAPETSDGYYTILDCAGSPVVAWNSSTGTLKITANMANGGQAALYEEKIPLQRWNNIMVTFSEGTADVYFNNTLVATKELATPQQNHGELIVGDDAIGGGGAKGGVANVVYCPTPATAASIDLNYRLTAPTEGV